MYLDLYKLGFKEGDETRKMVENLRDEVDACRKERSSKSVKNHSLNKCVMLSPTKCNTTADMNQMTPFSNFASSGFEAAMQSAKQKKPQVQKIQSMKVQARDIFYRTTTTSPNVCKEIDLNVEIMKEKKIVMLPKEQI